MKGTEVIVPVYNNYKQLGFIFNTKNKKKGLSRIHGKKLYYRNIKIFQVAHRISQLHFNAISYEYKSIFHCVNFFLPFFTQQPFLDTSLYWNFFVQIGMYMRGFQIDDCVFSNSLKFRYTKVHESDQKSIQYIYLSILYYFFHYKL